MRRLLTTKELAELLSVRPSTIYQWVKQQAIPHVVLSEGPRKNCIRFQPEQIETWLERRQRRTRRGAELRPSPAKTPPASFVE